MANLIMSAGTWATTTGLWGKLIGLFYNFINNMGWTIVVFTVCLKLILIPLDIYQRHVSATTTEKQAEMQPELDKVQKLYGSNQEMLNKKTMEIYKNHNFNMGASCLGLLLNLVLTLVVFLTLFSALRSISRSMIIEEYEVLRTTYVASYAEYTSSDDYTTNYNAYVINYATIENQSDYDSAIDYAEKMSAEDAKIYSQTAVYDKYQQIKESWLWIKNIYLTDTSTSPFPDFDTFVKNSGLTYSDGYISVQESINETNAKITDTTEARAQAKIDYELINAKIITTVAKEWNGYYILIVLAGLITYLSTKVTRMGQTKQVRKIKLADGTEVEKEVDPMGMMGFMLPVLMVFFTLSYTGLFAIYIVINSAMSILISLATYIIRKQIKKAKEEKIANGDTIILDGDYRRSDKYVVIEERSIKDEEKNQKKEKKSKDDDLLTDDMNNKEEK